MLQTLQPTCKMFGTFSDLRDKWFFGHVSLVTLLVKRLVTWSFKCIAWCLVDLLNAKLWHALYFVVCICTVKPSWHWNLAFLRSMQLLLCRFGWFPVRALELHLSWTSSCLHDLCEEVLVPNTQKYEKPSQNNSSPIVDTFKKKKVQPQIRVCCYQENSRTVQRFGILCISESNSEI